MNCSVIKLYFHLHLVEEAILSISFDKVCVELSLTFLCTFSYASLQSRCYLSWHKRIYLFKQHFEIDGFVLVLNRKKQ